MADIYRVKLSDGRTVRVQSDSGPPSEDAILAQLSSSTTAPPTAPPAAAPPPDDGSFKFQPGESTGHAMLRYGGNELMGAVRSPLDMLKGLVQAPGAIWKGYTQDIPALLSDPSLLTELPGVAWDAAKYLGTHPEELGSQLGQAVIGAKAVPAVAKGLRPSNIGSAASTFGRFVEGAGGDIASHGVLKGLAKAAVAPAVEKVGQFLQRGGAALEGRPVVTPGESAAGFPRLTPTEAPAAPTPVLQPGESLEGFPRVTPTEAPAAPTPVPQPGESLEGFPRTTPTEAPVPPTPVTQPGESLPGYPRGTVTPPPSIVETLTQRSGAPRGVARPQTPVENLVANLDPQPAAAPPLPPEDWITPAETLQSVGAPTPTGGRGFWSGLRRGDLWPQLQEEMLASAEAPAPPSAAPTRPGRTGPGAQGKGGRFAPKETAAPTVAPASAPPVETPPPATTPAQAELVNDVRTTALKGRKAPAAQKAPANPDWPWKLDEATGEWIETRPPVTTSARPTRARPSTSAAKLRADTTRPPAPTTTESASYEPPPPTQQEYIAEATRSLKEAKMPVPPEVADGTRMLNDEEMNQLAIRSRRNPKITLPVEWQ